MAFLADSLGWNDQQTVFLGKTSFYFKLASIFRKLSSRLIACLFIGNKNSWVHEAFYLGLDSGQVVFVDDGLATVKYYHAIHDETFHSRVSSGKRRILAAMGIQLNRARDTSAIAFFTCFPLSDSERISVEVHDFPLFRRTFRTQMQRSGNRPVVAFLGQPFGGMERLEQLKMQMQLVVQRHKDARILYFLHRKEVPEELEKVLGGFPVEIRQAGRPIEVEVALSGESYLGFYSFASTALFTIKKIFPEMQVFQIDDKILASRLPYYDEIVEMLHQIGVKTTGLHSFAVPE
ncbi:alpha-2,8-polysialyltransferase family protein [Marinobacter sp. M216]|uniref:Alpha-2,8-polysialyltransferase family protein n=1 Tax=Marinobacter albus TaxID=3030833 RepID=A0ABT7HJ95_9GAMM|nr:MULTISPECIES: alpha-2,8-polysialyltransferase family protein [unclassified Marinobacter]MBW7473022.1 alpha-2,8-polysialyltransferase family protein [Marinobacter sp. F4218]MDK9559585.1 alpha-2,8-polysialyltransferase family protein [Marinobacter sp. M216]